ncbi:hypothetical protein BDE02_03G135100 [Populus trichocarpa]|nr:hypothetical protein BDE02_03G135100 [Populus trichocarpa]
MKNSDTQSLSVERMREAQAQLKTPYLVLSSHVKPGQTSDPRSGFATVDKDLPGGLTPMLGDKKVEHFLGIKRKLETENSSAHQRSLKFGSVVEIFCWRTHGSKRDSENLRAHYSVSLTLKGTHSDGYGYFSICFGTV